MTNPNYVSHCELPLGTYAIEIVRSFGATGVLLDGLAPLEEPDEGTVCVIEAGLIPQDGSRLLLHFPDDPGKWPAFIERQGILMPAWATSARRLVGIRRTEGGKPYTDDQRTQLVSDLRRVHDAHLARIAREMSNGKPKKARDGRGRKDRNGMFT